jgi:hypothetical protein
MSIQVLEPLPCFGVEGRSPIMSCFIRKCKYHLLSCPCRLHGSYFFALPSIFAFVASKSVSGLFSILCVPVCLVASSSLFSPRFSKCCCRTLPERFASSALSTGSSAVSSVGCKSCRGHLKKVFPFDRTWLDFNFSFILSAIPF